MEMQLVVFTLANEHYGVDIFAVNSIIELKPITPIPYAPSFVEGVTNLYGVILPVIDLRKRFGLAVKEAARETRIVVIEVNQTQVGMVVDGVTEVLTVSEEFIEPPSPLVTTVDSVFLTGIAKVGDERLIILVDLEKILSPEEQVELQATLEQMDEEEVLEQITDEVVPDEV